MTQMPHWSAGAREEPLCDVELGGHMGHKICEQSKESLLSSLNLKGTWKRLVACLTWQVFRNCDKKTHVGRSKVCL